MGQNAREITDMARPQAGSESLQADRISYQREVADAVAFCKREVEDPV